MSKIVFFLFLCLLFLIPSVSAASSPNLYLKTTGNQVDIYLHPTQAISTFAFKLQATNVDITDATGQPLTTLTVNPAFTQDGSWLIPFKKVVRQNHQVWIEFAGANISQTGWQPQSETLLTSFYVTPTGKSPSLAFDQQVTAMMAKSTAQDIISLPTTPTPLELSHPNWLTRLIQFVRNMIK